MRIDLNRCTANMLIPEQELDERRAALKASGGYSYPVSQTPWQEIQRDIVGELSDGMVLKPAVKYQRIHTTFGLPRDNHRRPLGGPPKHVAEARNVGEELSPAFLTTGRKPHERTKRISDRGHPRRRHRQGSHAGRPARP